MIPLSVNGGAGELVAVARVDIFFTENLKNVSGLKSSRVKISGKFSISMGVLSCDEVDRRMSAELKSERGDRSRLGPNTMPRFDDVIRFTAWFRESCVSDGDVNGMVMGILMMIRHNRIT